MHRVRIYGDPILRQRAHPIENIDDFIRSLVDTMFQTMHVAQGVGLAAPQIGQSIALTVIDPRPIQEDSEPFVILNPRIVDQKGEFSFEEGCLSIPDIRQDVIRPEFIVVEGLNLEGKTISVETGGILARILQHEIDHLNGKLFIDHLGTVQRRMIESQLKEIEQKQKREGA